MMPDNQKALVLVLGLVLAFSFSADASQVLRQSSSQSTQGQDKQDLQAHDPVVAVDGQADEDDDQGTDDGQALTVDGQAVDGQADDDEAGLASSGPVYQVKAQDGNAKKEHEEEEEEEEDEHGSKDKHSSHASKKESMRLELSANLRQQSDLKHTIEHLTEESESDEEIEDSEKLVANQTDSVALAGMLSHMWKEQRMFELPAYSKHVEHELQHLKLDEKVLEAKLKGEHVKEEKKEDEEEKGKHGEEDKDMKHADDHQGQTSAVNFWRMSHRRRESVFVSSLVYLLAGVLAAVLFKQVRAKYFEPEERLDAHPSSKDFSFSVFGCLGDVKLCVLGFCCPCLAWANTVERRLKTISYWKAFLTFFGLMLLPLYTMGISFIFVLVLGVHYRQKLRDSYGIDSYESGNKSTVAIDILLWCFCQPCAIIQEAREESSKRETALP